MGWEMPLNSKYLWTLPMFHCNGWVFPWTLALSAGTNVCLRKVTAANIYNAIADHGVTHMCGAPIVLNTLAQAPAAARREFPQTVKVMTAAAPPPPRTLQQMQEQGFDVLHVYGAPHLRSQSRSAARLAGLFSRACPHQGSRRRTARRWCASGSRSGARSDPRTSGAAPCAQALLHAQVRCRKIHVL